MPVPRLTHTRWRLAAAGAEPPLGPDGGVGVVVDDDRQPHPLRQRLAQRLVAPRQVRGEHARSRGRRRRSRRRRCPTAAISSRASLEQLVDHLDDGVLDDLRALVDRCGVSRRARASTVAVGSTTPPATLVPPMSMPIASGPSATGCLLGVVGVADRDGPARRRLRRAVTGGRAAPGRRSPASAGVGAVGAGAAGRLRARSVSTVAARSRGRPAGRGSRG